MSTDALIIETKVLAIASHVWTNPLVVSAPTLDHIRLTCLIQGCVWVSRRKNPGLWSERRLIRFLPDMSATPWLRLSCKPWAVKLLL